jgi:hypothetical protein
VRLPPLAGLASQTTCFLRDSVTIELAGCLWGFCPPPCRPSDALVTVKSIRRTRTRTRTPASAHRARVGLHLRSKVQVQIGGFRGHTPRSGGRCAFDTPQAASTPLPVVNRGSVGISRSDPTRARCRPHCWCLGIFPPNQLGPTGVRWTVATSSSAFAMPDATIRGHKAHSGTARP